jgi:hypothetical protein
MTPLHMSLTLFRNFPIAIAFCCIANCKATPTEYRVPLDLKDERLQSWCVESIEGWSFQVRFFNEKIEASRVTLAARISKQRACGGKLGELGITKISFSDGILRVDTNSASRYIALFSGGENWFDSETPWLDCFSAVAESAELQQKALEPGEEPWSPSGRWLAWKSTDLTRLHFSDSEPAKLSKEGTLLVPKWSVRGDPLGLIWQEKWLSDDQLLVGTGSGEYVCYGIFDFNQHEFYSLACSATPAATLEELSRAIGDPEAWLDEKGLLADRARWRLVDPRNFPWEGD